jgi:gliding motility-associated-like protein
MRWHCIVLLFLFAVLSSTSCAAQCTTTINSFPYFENFEAGQANWTTGGSNNDWAYGTPTKNIITSAASGIKCWITGGLTGNNYSNGANAWLMSPCYNFTGLTNPQIAFSIFWETERRFDGASFQYSTDGGNNWQTLGSTNSNSSCLGVNWFNFSPINTLGIAGWSGTILPTSGNCQGTGGSDGWVTAKHTLQGLGGQSSVRFRFIFGAGTTCNNFNGFAVDDIAISEAPPNNSNFIYTCNAANTVVFTNTSSVCASNFVWNFGDINSPSNISNAENPTHIFSAPGSYSVSLTVTFPGNIIVTKTQTVIVLNVTTVVAQAIQCNGNANGSLTATVTGGNGSYNYLWNTTPTQTTATITNLIAGNYSVTVSATNACTTTATITLTQPAVLDVTVTTKNDLCKQANGQAAVFLSGGVTPYTYSWSNGATSASLNNLNAGTYFITAKDVNNCLFTTQAIVKDSSKNLQLFLGKDTSFCPGNTLVLNAGNFANYLWQNFSNTGTYTVTKTGIYFVKATDIDGCSISDTIKINVDCSDIYFPSAFSPNKDPLKLNETFGPLGNLSALTSFSMSVYGRWGQLIYSTTNPFEKWDGRQNGVDMDLGIYVWIANYSLNNEPLKSKKGTVMIIR